MAGQGSSGGIERGALRLAAVLVLTGVVVSAIAGVLHAEGKGDLNRWLYRGHRPNALARVLNSASGALAATGLVHLGMVRLDTTGRKSGKIISLPVVVAEVDGDRYLVSMLGENVNWVRNVHAAGGRAALQSGHREEVRLDDVPVDQRAPILKAYLQRAPGARAHIPVDPDASLAEFEKISADFPVFHVVPSIPDESPH